MKKSVFAFLVASLCLVACQIEIVDPNESNVSGDILSAKIEQNEVTKTVLGESNNVLWSENDQIVAFMKSSFGHKYQIQSSYAGKTYAYFSKKSSASGDDLTAGMEWDHNVAYYPYSESVECVKSGDNYTLEVVLPAEQTYEANSFGNGFFPMVAVSEDNDITFMNVCGGIKLQLLGTATIISIKITGNDNETLSGDAVVTAYHDSAAPTIEMLTQASSSVVLNCGEGVQLNEASPTNFILSLPPTLFTKGFVVTILDSMGGVYELNSGKQNEVRRSSLLVMPPIDIRETVVSTRMLKLVSIDYNSYQIEVTVPETVSPDGNIIRYAYGCEAIVNQNLKTGWDYDSILQWNGGDRNTTDISRVLTIQETCDVDGSYIIEPIAPGEPTVFIAGEYTRDGQLIGEPEIIKFKTKEPSVLNADFDVTIEDVTSTDATFCVMPDDDIYLYCMIVLDDETYNNILSNIVSESDLQWFVSSYYAMYSFGTYLQIGGCTFNLSNFFVSAPPADTKYHILITGLGNQEGTSQCFKHVEFKTEAKQRSQGPSITVTHLPEKSSDNRCVFNIKCTSVDNKDAGAVVQGYFAYANICDWESALNQGLSYEEILKHSQYFSSFELHMINSDCGYDLSFDLSNGYETSTESTRVAFLFYNDEFTPSDVIITDVEGHLTLPSPPPLIQ